MIVDSHGHAFPAMGERSGHQTSREHLRYIQHMLRFHHQPVRRLDDGAVVTEQTLYDGRDPSLDGLTDVGFRTGEHGRFVWSVDGVDHSIQYLPPAQADLSAPPELLLAQMDYAGVDRAVLQNGHSYGRLNRYLADAVRTYPDRFWALAMVDEWWADHPSEIRALNEAIQELGLHALWFMTGSLRQHGRTDTVDDPTFKPFWDRVQELQIPVYWFVNSAEPGLDAYLDALAAFGRWVRMYPDLPCMFTHGLPPSRFMKEGRVSIPAEAWEPLKAPNVLVEVLIPISQGAMWEYPYIEAQPLIKEYYERLGPDKLAWGSDMPNVERHCTYRQSLDYLRLYCDFIPSADMAKICGDNVARLFGAL